MGYAALLRGLAALFAGLVFLSACVVEPGPVRPPPGPGPGPGSALCTREFQPVCARRGDQRRTFSNACLARTSGFHVIREGQCRAPGSGGGQPQFCTREYRPVCARQGSRIRTFGNSCEANAAGWRVIAPGRC